MAVRPHAKAARGERGESAGDAGEGQEGEVRVVYAPDGFVVLEIDHGVLRAGL